MREYARVYPSFWIGKTGKQLRKCGLESQIVAMYVLTCPHANMIGLYYLPIPYISYDTGIPLQGACKALARPYEAMQCNAMQEQGILPKG